MGPENGESTLTTTIWHNPKCSKSRQTLQLLRDRSVELDIVEYLKNPPEIEEIAAVLKMLNIKPRKLMRTSEDTYREQNLADETDDSALIEAMWNYPILIERPIVIHEGKAMIGRPPEAVLSIL